MSTNMSTNPNPALNVVLDRAAELKGLESRTRALSLVLDVSHQSIIAAVLRGGLSPRLAVRAVEALPDAGVSALDLLTARRRDPFSNV